MSKISDTPTPPYYAVIFTSYRTEDENGYGKTAERMVELASSQPGFLGIESARESVGITVSFWTDLDSIREWKKNSEHIMAQGQGRDLWYSKYKVRIAKVECEYEWEKG